MVDFWASSSSRICNPGFPRLLARRAVEKGAKFYLWDLGNAARHPAIRFPEILRRLVLANPRSDSISINIADQEVEGLLVLMCMGAVTWRAMNNFRRPVWL